MDTLFFLASKIFWALASPDSLLLIMLLCSWALLALQWRRSGMALLSASSVLLLLIALLPIGEWLYLSLENRFPENPELPARVDGIIVLGGAINPGISQDWNQIETNEGAERLHAFVSLARQFPEARLVFSGGSGTVTGQDLKEADYVPEFLRSMGLGERPLILESESRNTWENALLSKELAAPQRGEQWIMITSAFHMPRAIGIFCIQEWPVTPWPVDHRANRDNVMRLELQFADHLGGLRSASREWLGLLVYRLTGRTYQLLPSVTDSIQGRCPDNLS